MDVHNLYSLPHIVTLIKRRKKSWEGYLVWRGNVDYKTQVKKKDHLRDVDLEERLMLKRTIVKYDDGSTGFKKHIIFLKFSNCQLFIYDRGP
jgi:hypothetical protein